MDETPHKLENYRPRLVDSMLRQKLRISGAVLVEGPKWCGKTTTCEQISASVLRLENSGILRSANLIASNNPNTLLIGGTPRLIDEWQEIPELWDAARSETDKRNAFGQFIFTGSATLSSKDKDKIRHSGAGRFARIKMRTMSLYESGESNGAVSLKDLFNHRHIQGMSDLSADDLSFAVCRGGFPQSLAIKNRNDAVLVAGEYYDAIVNSDISRVDNTKKNPIYVKRFMQSYSRLQGEQSPLTTIQNDMGGITGNVPSINTVTSYYDALKSIFVIDDVAAWRPNLRSKAAIRVTDTRYYTDPSIAVAGLDVTPKGLLADANTFGFIFEALCMRDLRIYAEYLGGKVSRYRDGNGLECDAVVHLPDNKYGFVQMKLGGDDAQIEEASEKMKALAKQLDENQPQPAFMMTLTGMQRNAYRREDGVYVVPIGCLKP